MSTPPPCCPPGPTRSPAELAGFKKVSLSNIHVGVDQKVTRRPQARPRPDDGDPSTIQAETPLIQTTSSDLGATIARRADRSPAPQRPELRQPDAHDPRRPASASGRQHRRRRLAWPGARDRASPPTASAPATTTTCSTASTTTRPGCRRSSSSRAWTPSTSSRCRRAPTPPSSASRWAAWSTSRSSRARNAFHGSVFEFLRNDALRRQQLLQQPRRARQARRSSSTSSGAPSAGRIVKDRTFFFVDYQGLRINQGQTYVSTVPSALMRAGNFSEINRPIYDPLNRAAVPGQHHPGATGSIPRRATSSTSSTRSRTRPGTRARHRPDHQQLRDQPRAGAAGQPVRRQARPQRLAPTTAFFVRYSFQKTHRVLPATLPHGDAGATFGAGEGNIKAQGLAFNDTHTFSNNAAERVPLRLELDQVLHDPDRLRHEPRRRRSGIPGINLNDVDLGHDPAHLRATSGTWAPTATSP